jgi:hypothetical protein
MSEQLPEPWLRGPLAGVSPFIAPTMRGFEQALEDLAKWTEGLTEEQIWRTHGDIGSLGFHMKHIAGSTERLATYAAGLQLTPEQLTDMKAEQQPGESREELLARMGEAFRRAAGLLRSLDPAALEAPREIGRKRLPSTAIGVVVHIAEHAARHVGEAIVIARLSRR